MGMNGSTRTRHRALLGTDGPPDEATLRSLGTGSQQAAPGTHTHGPGGGTTVHDHDAAYAPIGLVASVATLDGEVEGLVVDVANHEVDHVDPAHTHPHDHDGTYAPNPHDHDAEYATDDHIHTGFADDDHTHNAYATTTQMDAAIATHESTPHGDPDHTHTPSSIGAAEDDHTHPPTASVPSGTVVMWFGTVASIPSGWVLCDGNNGTPDLRGMFVRGAAAGQNGGGSGGSDTHPHSVTQPNAHTVTQPNNHAVTQPGAHSDHAAQAHSAHAGATVGNHTDIVNHTHTENINTATTGGAVGFPALKDTSTSGSEATGLVTGNPTSGGVAAQVHAVGQASAHSDHAALSHSAHSGAAVDAHAGTAVSAHAGAAVANGDNVPAHKTTLFIMKA